MGIILVDLDNRFTIAGRQADALVSRLDGLGGRAKIPVVVPAFTSFVRPTFLDFGEISWVLSCPWYFMLPLVFH